MRLVLVLFVIELSRKWLHGGQLRLSGRGGGSAGGWQRGERWRHECAEQGVSHLTYDRGGRGPDGGSLYPAWTRWGTYLGYCSRRDGARTHTLNNPQV